MYNNSLIHRSANRPRVVILGGGYAGLYCALRLVRRTQGRVEIHLVNPRPQLVERIRLHQTASGATLRRVHIPELLAGLPITFHVAAATGIDWRAKHVTLNNGAVLEYDRLVYALGSRTDRTLPGAQAHALALDSLDEAATIAQRLQALPRASHVLVVGGGLTGTELVFELAARHPHLTWTLVTQEAYGRGYAPGARAYFLAELAQSGITLRTGVSVTRICADHLETDQGEMPFDLCLWAGSLRGFELGRVSGLAVNELDQVRVDATLRSVTAPEVYAVGDGAALPDDFAPAPIMGCKIAVPMGQHAAENLAAELTGRTSTPFRYNYLITCVSIGRTRGLIQFLQPNGEAKPRFLTGKLGALVKELICWSTIFMLQVERRLALPAQRQAARPNHRIQKQVTVHDHGR